MSAINNPLKQYFRRPSIYIRLPSGGKDYDASVIDMPENGEIPIYPMTALDEITSKTPDSLFNGTAIVDLIKSCVPNIKDPWKISNTDLDTILIGIRVASEGNNIEINTTCPSCKEANTYEVNLVQVLPTMKAPDFSKPMQLGELEVKFRSLTYKEVNDASIAQFELQKLFVDIENIENDDVKLKERRKGVMSVLDITMNLIAQTIEYIKTPNVTVTQNEFILDFIKNCDKNIYAAIRDKYTELREQTQVKPLHISCPACNHEYDQSFSLNVSDFFG